MKDELFEKEIVKGNKINRYSYAKPELKEVFENIITYTSFLPESRTIEERIRCILYDIKETPVCQTCGKFVNFQISTKRFSKYCSVKCSANNENTKKLVKDTCLEKYGTEHHLKSKIIREKIKTTCLEKYGVDNISKCTRDKALKTIYSTYDRWWGDEKRFKEIFLKYDSNPIKIVNETGLSCSMIYKFAKKYNLLTSSNSFGSYQEDEVNTFIKDMNYQTITNNKNILNFGYEIDIFIPEKNVAIEYNGLYWHSEKHDRNKSYHLNKTKMCQNKNIKLIHIFEDDWVLRKDIVKSRLKHILGKSENTIYARKCYISEVSNEDKKNFLNENHIQGDCQSSTNLGLYTKDSHELVSIMTFGKSRFDKKYDIELLRFTNKLNTSVVGGASKLFTYFIKNNKNKSIISYADKKWSEGNLYKQLGFSFLRDSPPSYKYFNGTMSLHSRMKFQKHKLKDMFPDIYDESSSESEIMRKAGYFRIWDCGNSVWEYKV